jgi:CDP-glycerol glycerophosphotransferase
VAQGSAARGPEPGQRPGSEPPFAALPLISVVIPVFEVAEYLPRCLDSVLGQPGPPIEVIAVDDASPDGSAAILDARAAADPRLRVVHLPVNGGQGPARNAGLDLASGEYVWFVDGDDQLADGALAAIGARLAHSRPDVLLIDWVSTYAGGRTAPSPGTGLLAQVPAGGCTLEDLPRLIDLTMTSWSKLLRREFLTGLDVRFASGIHEDVLVTCAALLAAKSIEAVDQVCYRYRSDRGGSAMVTTSAGHLAIFASYDRVFARLDQAPASDAVRAAIFDRAIWHYTTVLEARGTDGRGVVPRRERRAYFARMHADFTARRPPGYRFPAGARGMKFRLVAAGRYPAYALLSRLNRLRVAHR